MMMTGFNQLLFACLLAAVITTVNPMGPWPVAPEYCDPMSGIPLRSSPSNIYNERVGTGIAYNCPAHLVSVASFRRLGSGTGCTVLAGVPLVTPQPPLNGTNCTTANSTSSSGGVTTTSALPTCNTTTSPKLNFTYTSVWMGPMGACVPGTCLPVCANGATCYCGQVCRCACPLGYTGSDCSINTLTIPNFNNTKLLYAFADPHWTFFPGSNNPWLIDLTGNGFHGEIIGWVGIDPSPGPYGSRGYTSFIFGTNNNSYGYIKIANASYDLTQLALNPLTSKYTIMAYYRPFLHGYNESVLFHFGKSGSVKGTTISTTREKPGYYFDSSLGGYGDAVTSPYTATLSNTNFNFLHFEIDNTINTFGFETGVNNLQSTTISDMLGSNNQGIYIGRNTNPTTTNEPMFLHLEGNLASFVIANNTGVAGYAAAHQAFSANNFGQGMAPYILENTYSPCPILPTRVGMPSKMAFNTTIGDALEYICPPFYTNVWRLIKPDGTQIWLPGVRIANATCTAGGWGVYTNCAPNPAPIFCDPICINGGTCMCTKTQCHCQCWPGFTGPDCFAPTSAIPTNFIAFWPITQESMNGGTNNLLQASDFSNNGMSINVQNMAFDIGPWNALNTAARQHYLRANSFMFLTSPFVLSGTSDFTIFFYIKIPHAANSLPGRASLPLFVYSSPADSVANLATSFFLDESNGTIIYYPGGIYLNHVGDPLTLNATTSWVPVKIAYSSATGCMGTASWDAVPDTSTPVSFVTSANSTLYFGYDDVLDRVSDMSLTCVGVYSVPYTDQLAWSHGRVCQMFSKQKCHGAPYPDTTAVQSAAEVYSAGTITYTCFNGMIWNTSHTMMQMFGCNPNKSLYPQLQWDIAFVPGVCMADPGVCHPTCQNNGTCVTTSTPATCSCTAAYIGLDCSIPRNIFPSSCNLVSFWPLTTMHITKTGFAADLWGPNPASINTTSIFFPDNIGPFATSGLGVAQFTDSMPGTVQVAPATSPFPSGSSFMVGAFVRFDVTAGTNESDLYPLISFTNRGVSNSPVIYISPMGNGQFNYKSASNAYSVSFDAGGMFIGISASWAYVAVQYDVVAGTIAMSVNGSVFGAAILVSPVPMFSTRTMYIGSVDWGLVWPGEITCLSIYNWVLTNAQLLQLMAACQQVLGGSAAPVAPPICNACSGINMPAGGFAVPARNDVVMPFNTIVTYRAPPFTMFSGSTSSRSTTAICTNTGAWSPVTIVSTTPVGLVTCDPACMNGGTCNCNNTTCSCACLAAFTGFDCAIAITNLPTTASAFWPLTGDTMWIDSTLNSTVALDFSGNGHNLVVGQTVASDTGIFGTPYSAIRFRNGQLNSFLTSSLTLNYLSSGSPFTILFYMKYNPASDNQPILAYWKTAQQNSEFWIDQTTGQVQYLPDNVLLGLTGTDLGNQAGMVWIPVAISNFPSSAANIGTATYSSSPSNATTSVGTILSSAKLYVGYSNSQAPVTADISISCLAIYPASFTAGLASSHGQKCQILSKVLCPGSTSAPTFSYRSAISVYPTMSVTYYCWSGYYWSTNSQQQTQQTCTQSASITPTMSFSGVLPGSCTAATVAPTCYPPCLNGGTCVAGAPTTTCSCATGYGGVDCSINLATLPFICQLKHFWPLTTQHIDNLGRGADVVTAQQQPLTLTSSVLWPQDVGLYATLGYGVASFASSAAYAAKATMPATAMPFLSKTSFTISAYVRFDASATYATLYPIVAFSKVWTNPSPAIFLSPAGRVVMLYKYAASSYSVAVNTTKFIGIQPWAFITVRYNYAAGLVDVTLNGNSLSPTSVVSPTPMFSTNTVYIGSADTAPAGGTLILNGQMACVSVYAAALTAAEILQLKLACDAILGGTAAPVATTTCFTCSNPPSGGLAMEVIGDLTYPPNTVTSYTAPALSRYPAPSLYRTYLSSTCLSNLTWNPPTIPAVDSPITPTVMCDPVCRNGGQCQCSAAGCQCSCLAGFTGKDCVCPTALLTAGVKAFWPLTADTTGRDALGQLFAYDFSGMAANLLVGSGVILEDGPFSGTIKSAFRFRSQVAGSVLQAYTSGAVTMAAGSFTIILYAKYNSVQGGHQPLLSWPSPNTQIWISSATGGVLYYPGGAAVTLNGTTYTASPDTWIPLVVTYNSALSKIGSATYDYNPNVNSAIAAPVKTGTFYVGSGDATVPASFADATVACVGLYQGIVYSATLAQNHGKLCQQFSKQQCSSAPSPTLTSSAFTSNRLGVSYIGESVIYTCIGGYSWSTIASQTQSTTCSQVTTTSKTLPQLAWSQTFLNGSCKASTSACYPSCLNGGTCMSGNPTATCACAVGYGGFDCSIGLSMLPQRCSLVSLWPLTSNHVNNLGLAADIMRSASGGASLPLSTISFPTNGPYSSITRGVLDFTATSVGAVQLASPYPWPPLSSFTISAFIRFSMSANYYLFYPLMAFTAPAGLTDSPGLFISPTGAARFYFVSAGSAYQVNLTAPLIGLGPWAFVSFIYDSTASTIAIYAYTPPTAPVYGTPVALASLPVSATSNPLYIGSTDIVPPADSAAIFAGQIGCLSIYKTALAATDLASLLAGCQNILGNVIVPPAAAQCNVCTSIPYVPLALPSRNSPVFTPGQSLTYSCPAFTGQVAPTRLRSSTLTCLGGEIWQPATPPQCDSTDSPAVCDPVCLNGGTCTCQSGLCSCDCPAGYTSYDCQLPVNLIPSNPIAFWPLTADTIIRDPTQNNTPLAADLSGNDLHLNVGQGAGLDTGPFGPQSAFRFRSSFSDSYLSLFSSLPLATNKPFTILFYINYNVDAFGNQPIFSFSKGGSAFWIDQISSKVRYFPDDLLLPLNGPSLTSAPGSWMPAAITFTPSNRFAAASSGSLPSLTSTVTKVTFSGQFSIGFSDSPSPTVSDLSIACVGIYDNTAFSANLSYVHARACQRLAKTKCTSPPPVANTFLSSQSALAGSQLSYTCFGAGYYFNGTNSSNTDAMCAQSANSTTPSTSWSTTAVSEYCTKSNTYCYPACKNKAKCVSGSCKCLSGYAGIDCSLALEILTCQSHLQSLWPLTTYQINSLGQAVDAWSFESSAPLPASTIYAADDGPYSPAGFGLLRLTSTSPGAIKVYSPNWPSMSTNGTFFISAYVHFDLAASYTTLYPLVTFSNTTSGGGSPALFISKSGLGRMYYQAGGVQYYVDFSVPAPNVIGTATPRSFVRIEYDWDAGNISIATLNYETMTIVYGDPVAVIPPPSFEVNATMYIGSTDMPGLPSSGAVFPGEIACLAIYNHTLPDFQTKQALSACWDMLGGPAAGPAVQICTPLMYCPSAPNITNATLEVQVMAPPFVGQQLIDGMYTNGSRLFYVCNFNHSFVNYTVVEMNVTCQWGTWIVPYTFCKESPLQINPLALDIVPTLQSPTLLKYFDNVNDIILETSWRIANVSSATALKSSALVALNATAVTCQRYAAMAANLTNSQIFQIAKTCAAAMSNLMYAETNETQFRSAISNDVDRAENCSAGYYKGLHTTPTPTAGVELTPEELAQQFALFQQTASILTQLVEQALQSGSEFAVDERYFAARIKKLQLKELTGLNINCSLAAIQFPSGSNSLIQESASLSPSTVVSVVLVAYIDNVYDIEKPFNIPTVSIRVYKTSDLTPLTLNPATAIEVSAMPIIRKARLYSTEKIVVQCDVSKITCDLTTNADLLGSLVRFPMLLTAGNFFIVFPPVNMAYDAYIAFNSTPAPNNYVIHVRVNSKTGTVVVYTSGSTLIPSYNYDAITGLRLVVSDSVIQSFVPVAFRNSSKIKLFLNVITKRDTTGYSRVDDLPPELCDLQHCYGYFLKLDNASSYMQFELLSPSARRKKRSVSAGVASNSSTLELQADSSEPSVKFKSSYFGDLGTDLVITPNTIEFSDIFSRFSTLIANNSAVLVFIVLSILVLLVGLIITHYFDKRDLHRWAFLPLVSNQKYYGVNYYVSILYHSVRQSELGPKIYIRFIGDLCDMPFRLLEDGVRKDNFHGSHPANFLVTTYHWIGHIDKIELLVESKGKSSRKPFSLHVDKVFIIDAKAGIKYLYPVKMRITAGQSRIVTLASEDDVKSFRYLISGHTRGGITETHPWLSIAKRPLPSHWTRVERLACVITALFLAMLVNAMFYGKEESSPRAGVQFTKYLRISWFTIWTSFVGTFIIAPPTTVIGLIFKKIRRKSAEDHETRTTFNISRDVKDLLEDDDGEAEVSLQKKRESEESASKEKTKKDKKPFLLPYKCIFIAWFLVGACIFCAGFFIVLYSLSWGAEKSQQWLFGMVLHMIQDIVLVQTAKVVIFSAISATLLQLPEDGLQVGKMKYHPNNRKRQTEMFAKMRNVTAGIIHHIAYVLVFTLVINTTQNGFAYQQVQDLKPLFTVPNVAPVDGTITDYTKIYSWLSNVLLPNILSRNLLSQGLEFTASNIYSVRNHDVVLIGPIRLRQQRVSSARCLVEASATRFYRDRFSGALGSSTMRCQESFSSKVSPVDVGTSSEKRPFNGSWQLPLSSADVAAHAHYNGVSESVVYDSPWAYRSSDGPPYSGWQATYKTGGYYIDLPFDLGTSLANIKSLMVARWLDNSTTVLLVEFTLFNAQANVFAPVKIVFEGLDAGGMAYHVRIFPLQLYQYVGAKSMLILIIQIIWILLMLSHIYKMFRMIKRDGIKHFAKDGWNLFDVSHVLLSVGIVGLFVARVYIIMNTISAMQSYKTKFVSLDLLASWEDLMNCLYGISFFMALLLFFRNVSFHKHWSVFLGTLAKGKFDIASFVGLFALITFMFTSLGYCSFGAFYNDYKTFTDSMLTLIQNIIGPNSQFMVVAAKSGYAKAFCLSYSFVVIFLAVQVFMAILNVSYAFVAANVEQETDWDAELAGYISAGLDDMFSRKKKSTDEKSLENKELQFIAVGEKNFAELEHISYRIERFVNIEDNSLDNWGKNDRNMVSWISGLLKQHKGKLPATTDQVYSEDNSEQLSPDLQIVREQEVSIQLSSARRKSSADVRHGFSEYVRNPKVDITKVKNKAVAKLLDKDDFFVCNDADNRILVSSAAVRSVYASNELKKPRLDPIDTYK